MPSLRSNGCRYKLLKKFPVITGTLEHGRCDLPIGCLTTCRQLPTAVGGQQPATTGKSSKKEYAKHVRLLDKQHNSQSDRFLSHHQIDNGLSLYAA